MPRPAIWASRSSWPAARASSASKARSSSCVRTALCKCGRKRRPATEVVAEKRESAETRESKASKSSDSRSLRVDGDKLDKLIDLIGELVTAGATTTITARKAGLSELNESTLRLARLVEEVRDQALKLRMVQVGPTFSRFQRIVRDVAREIGKEIRLEISGAETELDKTLIESITDPLTHLVRNAIDHGIETAEVRRGRGKNVEGVVRLDAYHDSRLGRHRSRRRRRRIEA